MKLYLFIFDKEATNQTVFATVKKTSCCHIPYDISLLAAYFKEDATFLVKSFPIGATTVEICECYIPAAYYIQKGSQHTGSSYMGR
jgi:hypothetical protein